MIPKMIHQTWKSIQLPPEWESLQQTWLAHHPAWAYRFWTDEASRAFLGQYYPWFLPIYDAYDANIKRVDACRYFVLHHYGGVYVDLDFECLRPIDPLVTDKELVVGAEPRAHADEPEVRLRGFDEILCNAFMASRRGHPFWAHVFDCLLKYQHAPGVLDATGPFLLTRAYQTYPNPHQIAIVASDLLYPLDHWQTWDNNFPTLAMRERLRGSSYAIHYWHGSWRREEVFKAVRERLRERRGSSRREE